MITTQITRIRNADASETLRKHSDGPTLPFPKANLTALLTGVTDPIFTLKRIDNIGNAYPFIYQARNEAEFKTAN